MTDARKEKKPVCQWCKTNRQEDTELELLVESKDGHKIWGCPYCGYSQTTDDKTNVRS